MFYMLPRVDAMHVHAKSVSQ